MTWIREKINHHRAKREAKRKARMSLDNELFPEDVIAKSSKTSSRSKRISTDGTSLTNSYLVGAMAATNSNGGCDTSGSHHGSSGHCDTSSSSTLHSSGGHLSSFFSHLGGGGGGYSDCGSYGGGWGGGDCGGGSCGGDGGGGGGCC